MSYCPKCGTKVSEEMTFCPKCGAALKVEKSMPAERYRSEKGEKQEKQEKGEKQEKTEKGEQPEKYEKGEFGIIGPLIGGLILILVGFMFYLAVTGVLRFSTILPFFLIIIGAIVILGVIAGALMARGRHPKP
jgi:uncharacterized membrane protein YvbJ